MTAFAWSARSAPCPHSSNGSSSAFSALPSASPCSARASPRSLNGSSRQGDWDWRMAEAMLAADAYLLGHAALQGQLQHHGAHARAAGAERLDRNPRIVRRDLG